VIVILAVSIIVLVILLLSLLKTQRALRWWQSQQALQSHQVAESIRNGLLQTSFSLRRNLEVALGSTAGDLSLDPAWLHTLEGLHNDFKLLSDRLSPPYLEESLPLAIQYRVEEWQCHYPGCEFTLDLPVHWQAEPSEHSSVILTALDELWRLVCARPVPNRSIQLRLQMESAMALLRIQIWVPEEFDPESADLSHLARAFGALTDGTCTYQHQQNQLTMHFRWKYMGDSEQRSPVANHR
jgi:hypothetical protein